MNIDIAQCVMIFCFVFFFRFEFGKSCKGNSCIAAGNGRTQESVKA